MGIIPTTRGPLDAITVMNAPAKNRGAIASELSLNPQTAWDRESTLRRWYGSGQIGTLN